MLISIGQQLPNVSLSMMKNGQLDFVQTRDIFFQKRGILFAVPGAFTNTCSTQHLPGFIECAASLKKMDIDIIACLSVNDAFVMQAWANTLKVSDEIMMLSDGNCEFTKAIGMEFDLSKNGLGIRSRRYTMLIENNKLTRLELEEIGGGCTVSSAQYFLNLLSEDI